MRKLRRGIMILFLLTGITANGQLWKDYVDSARFFQFQGNQEGAADYYLKALPILLVDSAITITHAAIADSLGKLFIDQQKYKSADTIYRKSKEIREKLFGTNSLDYALSCFNLGYLYIHFLDKIKEAEFLLQESKKIRQEFLGTDNLDYALSCHYLGSAFMDQGKNDEALKLYLEVKRIREKLLGVFHPEFAKIVANIGNIYGRKGDRLNALSYYLQSRQSFENSLGNLYPFYLQVTINVAMAYRDLGQTYKALSLLTENQKKIENILGKKGWLYSFNSSVLGELYRDTGSPEIAEELFLERREMLLESTGKQTNLYAANSWNLGVLYFGIGQYKKAEECFIESKGIREKVIGKNNSAYAACCSNLAEVYVKLGEYKKAEALFNEGVEIRESVEGKSINYTIDCNKLGSFYLQTHRYEEAMRVLLDAKMTLEIMSFENQWQYIDICATLGMLYFTLGNYDEAKRFFSKSKNIIESDTIGQNSNLVNVYKRLAELEWKQNNSQEAYRLYEKALSLQNNHVKKIFQFTNEIEKHSYLGMTSDLTNSFYSFSLNNYPSGKQSRTYDLSALNRNLILSSSQQMNKLIGHSDDTSTQKKYSEWQGLKKELASWYSQPKLNRPNNIKSLEEKANMFEKELIRFVSRLGKQQQQKERACKDIQISLEAGEAAIEFAEFRYYDVQRITDSTYYIALILRKDKPDPELVQLFEKRKLDSILSYKSTSAGQHQLSYLYSKRQNEMTKSLYDIIWKPIEQKLTGIKTVYFAPAGALHKIAFSALPVSTTQVLSDKYQLVQLSTTASVGEKSVTPLTASDKIVLYGGVQYDADSTSIRQAALKYSANDVASRSLPDDLLREGVSDFYYLTGAEKEVTEIGNLARQSNYTSTVSDAMLATEESFKALTGKNSPAVLHIATHGFFFPDPKNEKKDDRMGGAIVFRQSDNPLIRSGLALAGANNAWKGKPVTGVEDGILTSYEVSNMYLPNTKLAVLSACETGLGDIQGSEGVYGLQRAFKMAGVQNLVMSLWKVDDKATSEFMEEFYKNLFAKQNINDAFYHAQTVMKNKYRNDPYKWAAWILVR